MDLEKITLAKDTLISFFDEVNKWNVQSYNLIQDRGLNQEIDEIITRNLSCISEKYCSVKASKDIGGSCSDISGYDVNFLVFDKYEILTKNKIQFFVTELNRSKSTYRYTMIYRNEKWLLDQKQVFRKFNNKWEKSYI